MNDKRPTPSEQGQGRLVLKISPMTEPHKRHYTVVKRKLTDAEPLPSLPAQEALRQVEQLRQIQAELSGTPLGRIQRVVTRRRLA